MRCVAAVLLMTGFASAAAAFDQPEVKFFVQRRSGGEMVECRVAAASLGEWAFVTLSEGLKIEAYASPLDAEGRTPLRVKIVSASRVTLHEFNLDAKLAQSSPQFTWSGSGTWPIAGVAILVESTALLATTRGKPSWRDFDPRTHPELAKEKPIRRGGCGIENVAAADWRSLVRAGRGP